MENEKLNYKILFVEDDKLISQNYIDGLKYSFKNLFNAQNGIQAYDIYIKEKPDIIILDINIPIMSGLDLLKKIRQKDINTKVIIFTSHSDRETLLEVSILKVNKYLIKPVKMFDLLDALDEVIKEIENFDIVAKKTLRFGEKYYWNFEKKELFCGNQNINLTYREKDILQLIFSSRGVITYDEILFSCWGNSNESNLKTLKTFMTGIRKKLPKNTILNEYGIGYKVTNV